MAVVSDVKDSNGLWVKSFGNSRVNKVQTKSYVRWVNMRLRCTSGSSSQKENPTYIDCTMSENFHDFQFFATWYTSQIGYGIKGYQLDKDILFNGNREYGENTCVLVPSVLNNFLLDHGAGRGDYPQGVHLNTQTGMFVAQISSSNRRRHLGYYSSPELASSAYKIAKEAEAYKWYERLKIGEFVVDERVIERMRTWTFKEK